MSTTSSVFDQRVAYRPAVVDLFRNLTGPEIQRVTGEIAKLQEQVNHLVAQIEDGERYISELRQAQKDVEASADLPAAEPPAASVAKCSACGEKVVQVEGEWTHSGRELVKNGKVCWPDRHKSPVAAPAGPADQSFERWEGAIEEERRAGSVS
ncbi:hypothetical protein FH608_046495 [Nonomuraea phyllanthi]|uniref:Uncharacterized protein n=1 Tax=Nonomuraea phyllanthi TaxID=2219224 RepID=A0A5C4V655_9ACTN|nr:hypothetical protein [Nonomuraea phyllanthi]KAB8186943.1 hypothetical protein FH608_046495 [Nonomuraea phyllanthi]